MKRIILTFVSISMAAVFACAQGMPARDYSSEKIEILKNNALSKIYFVPLEVGEISPEGWIRDWADLALDGITGHLDEYQPVYMHGWKGYGFKARGTNPEDGTRWPIEQCSYWLDGAVKLAYMTGDQRLIKKVSERLDIVVDGVLNGGDTFIWWKDASIVRSWFNNWGHGIMGRALMDYYQATRNPRILQALEKVYTSFYMMPAVHTGSIQHMMERNRGLTNADAMTELFLETGNTVILDSLRACASRPDTKEYFKQVASVSGRDKEGFRTLHGVSLYEGLRVPAILGLWSGDADGYRTARHLHDWAMEYNALPYGMPSCEEWLSGSGAFHSVETCVVPASMWTYNWLLRLSGDTSWCDLIESVFINAGPAPIARDFKTMSYYQQPNRISENLPNCPPVPGEGSCTFTDHGHEVLCCVGSCNWIIPNYVGNMWQATMDGGLAYLLYGPCRVNTMIGNTSVKLDCSTAYPFGESINVKISLSKPLVMPLYFHVPSWCKEMSVSVNGRRQKLNPKDGLVCVSREWKDGDSIEISLPMEVSLVEGKEIPYPREPYFIDPHHGLSNDLVADTEGGMPYGYVKYGPILFSLPIADQDENHVVENQKFNYALNIGNVRKDTKVTRHPMPEKWDWTIGNSPLTIEVKAGEFDWNPTQAQPMPKEKISEYVPTEITLVPYNLTKFRISMFPVTESIPGPRQAKRVGADNSMMDPAKGVMISGEQFTMCHVPSVAFGSDGMMYVSYYRDSTTTVENISNQHTHTVLARLNPSDPGSVQTFRHMGIGDRVGDFVQQEKSPYDPTLLALGDRIVYTFQSYENGERGYAASFFNVKEGCFEPRVERCTLTFTDRKGQKVTVPLTDSGRVRCYTEAFGYKEPKELGLCVLHSRYAVHNGEYYSVLSCDAPLNYAPLMVKTSDGVHFEVVFEMPEFNMGTCEVGQELYKGEFYILARTGQGFKDKKRRGVYIAKYSLDGECICAPRRVSSETTRPTMLVHKNRLYAFFNTTPLAKCSEAKNGTMRRSRMRVAMVTEDCHFSRYSDVVSPYSFQYYALGVNKGTIHIAYTEDRRLINPNIAKGNISVSTIKLFR